MSFTPPGEWIYKWVKVVGEFALVIGLLWRCLYLTDLPTGIAFAIALVFLVVFAGGYYYIGKWATPKAEVMSLTEKPDPTDVDRKAVRDELGRQSWWVGLCATLLLLAIMVVLLLAVAPVASRHFLAQGNGANHLHDIKPETKPIATKPETKPEEPKKPRDLTLVTLRPVDPGDKDLQWMKENDWLSGLITHLETEGKKEGKQSQLLKIETSQLTHLTPKLKLTLALREDDWDKYKLTGYAFVKRPGALGPTYQGLKLAVIRGGVTVEFPPGHAKDEVLVLLRVSASKATDLPDPQRYADNIKLKVSEE